MNFHDHFEEISKIKVLETDTLDDVLFRLGEKLCMCLHVERINVWVFREKPNRIECLGNFEKKGRKFSKGEVLTEEQIPSYFSHLTSDKSIRIKDVSKSRISAELKDNYCKLHGIKSIMDIPVRIEGKLAGVICFEDCKSERTWSDEEKNFALAVSQIVSLSIENQKRKNYQRKLQKALDEKDILLVEMHHRLKNNLTMLVSLLRLQTRNLEDKEALHIIENFENQILSISKVHEQLYVSGNFITVNLKSYLQNLLQGFKSGSEQAISFEEKLEDVYINSDKSVTIGLIANEIISNSMKYAFPDGKGKITIELKVVDQFCLLSVRDDGPGFEFTKDSLLSFGLGLIYDLSEQINAQIEFNSSSNGTSYELKIPL